MSARSRAHKHPFGRISVPEMLARSALLRTEHRFRRNAPNRNHALRKFWQVLMAWECALRSDGEGALRSDGECSRITRHEAPTPRMKRRRARSILTASSIQSADGWTRTTDLRVMNPAL